MIGSKKEVLPSLQSSPEQAMPQVNFGSVRRVSIKRLAVEIEYLSSVTVGYLIWPMEQ